MFFLTVCITHNHKMLYLATDVIAKIPSAADCIFLKGAHTVELRVPVV